MIDRGRARQHRLRQRRVVGKKTRRRRRRHEHRLGPAAPAPPPRSIGKTDWAAGSAGRCPAFVSGVTMNGARNSPSRVPFSGRTCLSGSIACVGQAEAPRPASPPPPRAIRLLPLIGGYSPNLSACRAIVFGDESRAPRRCGSPTARLIGVIPGVMRSSSVASLANDDGGKSRKTARKEHGAENSRSRRIGLIRRCHGSSPDHGEEDADKQKGRSFGAPQLEGNARGDSAVHGFAMEVDVETFDFDLAGDAQADRRNRSP